MVELFKIDTIIRNVIKSCFPLDWDEDYITRRLLNKLRNNLDSQKFNLFDSEYSLVINTFKSKGKLEYAFGDIAFLVKIQFKDEDVLEGVGFLEAKRKFKEFDSYKSLKLDQLKRIKKNAPHAMLLLYDYEPVKTFLPYNFNYEMMYCDLSSHANVCQMDPAIKLNKSDDGLHKICFPLSYQIVHRYFRGLDLEYSSNILNQAKGYEAKNEIPNYVITTTISLTEEGLERPDLNSELFEEFFD